MTALPSQQRRSHFLVNTVFNGLLFNITWFAIVFTHNNVFAVLFVTAHMLVHFSLMGQGWVEIRLITGVTLMGAVVDRLLFYYGVLALDGHSAMAPFWLTCLWPVLATTFRHAFSSLQQRPLLAAVLGAVGGSLSYSAGAALSDISFGDSMTGPVVMALLWAVLFPLLLLAANFHAGLKEETGV